MSASGFCGDPCSVVTILMAALPARCLAQPSAESQPIQMLLSLPSVLASSGSIVQSLLVLWWGFWLTEVWDETKRPCDVV